MKTILEIQNMTKSFGGIKALKGVTMAVAEREILAVIGPNGSGKTTLLNMITGVYQPDDGAILLDGRQISGLNPDAICVAGIARTFQNVRLFKQLTVLENVLIGGHHRFRFGLAHIIRKSKQHSQEEEAFRAEALHWLDFVGLGGKEKMVAHSLPYAQQRLLEIARALATRPQILLLDEPAAGMNSAEISHLDRLIRAMRESGLTIILIEHIMDLVREVTDRVVVLSYGEKIAAGSFDAIERDPLVIEAYLGKGAVRQC